MPTSAIGSFTDQPQRQDWGGKRTSDCYDAPMENALASWRQNGRIGLWSYHDAPKMYSGWHFSADTEGCASVLVLCDLLSRETGAAYRTLTLTDPRTVSVDHIFGEHGYRVNAPAKLRLCNHLSESWGTVDAAREVFIMGLSAQELSDFSQAVKDLSLDHTDFGVGFGQDDTILNFWRWPKNR